MENWFFVYFVLHFRTGEQTAKLKEPFIFLFGEEENIVEPIFKELKDYIEHNKKVKYVIEKNSATIDGYGLQIFKLDTATKRVVEMSRDERSTCSYLRLFFDSFAGAGKVKEKEDPLMTLIVQNGVEVSESVM